MLLKKMKDVITIFLILTIGIKMVDFTSWLDYALIVLFIIYAGLTVAQGRRAEK